MDYEALSQSAERRMLEHRRRELGVTTAPSSAWSRSRENPTSQLPAVSIDRTGARLDVSVTAWPSEGLIPGAVVTVTVVVSNGGIEPAEGVVIVAPAPSGSTYRPGTLKHDGRDADDIADLLFGEGFAVGTIVAAGRSALTWKLDVNPGIEDLIFAPSIRSDVPVVTARPLVLKRSSTPTAFKAGVIAADAADAAALSAGTVEHVQTTHEDVEAPFYELTPEEEISEEAVLTALEKSPPRPEPAPVVPEPPPAVVPPPPVAAAPPVVPATVAPPAPVPAPTPPPAPAPVRAKAPVQAPPARTAPAPAPALPVPALPAAAIYRTLRPGDLLFVERLLDQSLGLLPHFVLVNLLAAATTGDGSDPLGLAAFVDREATLLGRIKVASRLGKPLGLDEAPCVPPSLDMDAAGIRFANPPTARISGAVLLTAPLTEQRMNDARNAFDRPVARWIALRLVTLAFCVQDLADTNHPLAATVHAGLASYTAQARLAFIAFATRVKLDRRLDPTRASATQLDAAARTLIEGLRAAIAADE